MDSLVAHNGPAVKPARRQAPTLRPVGELVALFPESDPERFLQTFDMYALSLIEIQKLVLARDCPLATPRWDGVALSDWLRSRDVRIVTQTFLGTRRMGHARWMGQYRLILGLEVSGD